MYGLVGYEVLCTVNPKGSPLDRELLRFLTYAEDEREAAIFCTSDLGAKGYETDIEEVRGATETQIDRAYAKWAGRRSCR